MPCMQERLETLVCQLRGTPLVVTGILQRPEQYSPTQCADAVLEVRFFAEYLRADRPQALHRKIAQVRRVVGQPLAQDRFGAGDHRGGVP